MTRTSDEMDLVPFQPRNLQKEGGERADRTEELICLAQAELNLQVSRKEIDEFTDAELLTKIRQIDWETRSGKGIHRVTLWRTRARNTDDLHEKMKELSNSRFVEHVSKASKNRRTAYLRQMQHRTLAIRLMGLDALEQHCVRRLEWFEKALERRQEEGTTGSSALPNQTAMGPEFELGVETERKFRRLVGKCSRRELASEVIEIECRLAELQAHLLQLDIFFLDLQRNRS